MTQQQSSHESKWTFLLFVNFEKEKLDTLLGMVYICG